MPKKATAKAEAPAQEVPEAESQPTNEQIAALAHALWIERGCPEGTPEEDWFQAEERLRTAVRVPDR
jgi:hypothetical protein